MITMPYLVCRKCGGYYQLQDGESPDYFEDKCQCGGDLEYVESMEDIGSIGEYNTQNFEDHHEMEEFKGEDELGAVTDAEGVSSVETVEEDNKSPSSPKLFKISAVMAILTIIIISAGLITHGSNSYGVFNFNQYEKYSDEEINCFMESAFSPDDYGNSYDRVGKWNINVVRIKIIGSPTEEDMKTLNKAINDINVNVKDLQLTIDDKNQMEADIEIYFIPHSEFTAYSVNPSEVDGFTMWMVSTSGIYGGNSAGEIYKARVFIGIDGLSQERRSHVIVHELAHSLGLHHNQNQNSVLCKYGPDITEYSDLDKTMMRMLYRKDILPNMSRSQVENILNNSKKSFF
jgi:hypothetical protein